MNLRTFFTSAAAIGMMGGAATAKEPAKAAKSPAPVTAKTARTADAPVVENQKLAEAIGVRLTGSNVAEGSDVSIVTSNGVVTVSGPCRDAVQKKAILEEIRVVAGVKMVRDGLSVGMMGGMTGGMMPGMAGVQQVQAAGPFAANQPVGVMPGSGGPLVEPGPLGTPGSGASDGAAPPLPPYAWPTYAPHNNLSRVGYPTAYPYNAYPFIGPFYPFPKVPLGWRSVTMTWEDGHWWYGRTSTPQDYWRVRFW